MFFFSQIQAHEFSEPKMNDKSKNNEYLLYFIHEPHLSKIKHLFLLSLHSSRVIKFLRIGKNSKHKEIIL